MRIPSSFNDRNLYRDRAAVRRETAYSMRRVVRLVLALGVVLLVIRQAADPSIYRPFFPAEATSPASLERASAPPPQRPAGAPGGEASGQDAESAAVRATAQERELVDRLSDEQQQRLTRWLAHWRSGGRQQASQNPDSPRLENPTAEASLAALIAAIESQVPRFDSPEAAALLGDVPPHLLERLQDALDQSYQARVIDGAIWRSADSQAFYRYLEMAAAEDFAQRFLDSDPSPRRVGVLPLMQQPEQYLGASVWMYGSVARAVPVPAQENPFGIQSYWELWLRPDDGTERPVILYAPDVPADIEAIGPNASLQHGPQVAIAGRFLKRRLFGAVEGASESPVIVGRIWDRQSAVASAPAAGLDHGRLWKVIAAAAFIGLAIAGVLLWRSAVTARELRRLRVAPAALPPTFDQAVSRSTAADQSTAADEEGFDNDNDDNDDVANKQV